MKQIPMPNDAVRGTAARVRFGMNVKRYVRAAARDGMVWTPPWEVSVRRETTDTNEGG